MKEKGVGEGGRETRGETVVDARRKNKKKFPPTVGDNWR